MLFFAFGLLTTVGLTHLKLNRAVGVGCALTVALFGFLKGYVGTDTWSYVAIAEQVRDRQTQDLAVEAGYIVLVEVALKLTDDPLASVSLMAAFSATLISIAFLLLPRETMSPLVPLYICFFVVDNAFNGLRLGIAVGFCLLAVSIYLRGFKIIAVILVVAAISVQFTVVVLPALFLLRETQKHKRLVVPLVILTSSVSIFYATRIEEKFALYGGQEGKGWSGLGMLVLAALLMFISSDAFGFRKFYFGLFVASVLCVVPNEYGFLTVRVGQLLLLYFAFEIGLAVYRQSPIPGSYDSRFGILSLNRPGVFGERVYALRLVALLALIAIACILRLRNILTVLPGELSPYAPYIFR